MSGQNKSNSNLEHIYSCKNHKRLTRVVWAAKRGEEYKDPKASQCYVIRTYISRIGIDINCNGKSRACLQIHKHTPEYVNK